MRGASVLDVLFLRQGSYLFALPAAGVIDVNRDLGVPGAKRFPFGEPDFGDERTGHVLCLELPEGDLEAVEVGGQITFGSLAPEELWPLPPVVAELSVTTGISRVFRSSQDCIGFLLDPGNLPLVDAKNGERS